MLTRAALAAALIVACGVYTRGATGPEHPAARMPLSSMPLVLGDWHGSTDPPLAADVLSELGVDDYISRHYAVAGAAPVAVYVGYYASQRQGGSAFVAARIERNHAVVRQFVQRHHRLGIVGHG